MQSKLNTKRLCATYRCGTHTAALRRIVYVASATLSIRPSAIAAGRREEGPQDVADAPSDRVLRPRRTPRDAPGGDGASDDDASRPSTSGRKRLFSLEDRGGPDRQGEEGYGRRDGGYGSRDAGYRRSDRRDRSDRDERNYDRDEDRSGRREPRGEREGGREWRGVRGGEGVRRHERDGGLERRGDREGDRGFRRGEHNRDKDGRRGGDDFDRRDGRQGWRRDRDDERSEERMGSERRGRDRERDGAWRVSERRGRADDRGEDRRGGERQGRDFSRDRESEPSTTRSERGGRRRDDSFDAAATAPRRSRDGLASPAAAVSDSEAVGSDGPEVKVGVPRPPGSSTGNKPLPYDLPLVRPNDGDKGTFFAGKTWKQAGASADVIAALKTLGISRPSHIQAQAYSALQAPTKPGDAVVLADQAGSGKTLAYLLPLMQMLKDEEVAAGGRVTKPRCPRGIVVAPTVELVQQVIRVAKALSAAGLKCRSAAVTGGQRDEKARAVSLRTQKELLSEGVDLLVATPGRLLKHLERGHLGLAECRALVLDEVDVLMGDLSDFQAQMEPLRSAAPASLRFVMATATLPQHVYAELRVLWPGMRAVFGPGLHRTAAGLVEELVDCSGGDEISEESGRKRKLEALEALLARHRSPRTIVFCNKIESCRDVENFLNRADPQHTKFRVLPYHEAIRDELRAENMAEFLRPVGPGGAAAAAATAKPPQPQQPQAAEPEQPATDGVNPSPSGEGSAAPRQGERGDTGSAGSGGEAPLVLVATDRTSRGIDVLYCEHVVLFDFPRDPSEYVRRVGRTARGAGGRGTVSSLVLGRQVPLARDIIERNQKGMPVHSVPL